MDDKKQVNNDDVVVNDAVAQAADDADQTAAAPQDDNAGDQIDQTDSQDLPEPAISETDIAEGPIPEPAVEAAQVFEDASEGQEVTEPATEEEGDAEQTAVAEDEDATPAADDNGKWYVVHTFSGHENKVATTLRQRIESEHLENKIFDILVPTQDKIEIRGGKKETVKEKIFPGYILVKMDLDDAAWLAVRTTPGVTAFVGMNNRPTPIPDREVSSIVRFMTQGAAPTFKDVFMVDDTVRIIDGPFTDFIGKVESVDKEKGKVRVLVSIFGRETPVELDFLQVTKL
jgi:transcription termination/antitermination protein NusG